MSTDIADELRGAAAKLLETPARPVDEPLAAWLRKTSNDFYNQGFWGTPECPACTDPETYACGGHSQQLVHEGGCGGLIGAGTSEDCKCFEPALKVARAIMSEHKPTPTPAEALARLEKAREEGLDDALILGWIAATDPALVVRAVEEMESRRVDRAEVEES